MLFRSSTYIDLRAAANETSTAFGNPVGITLHPQFPAVPLLFITLEGMQSSSCEPGAQCAVHGTVLQITDHDGVGTEPRALLDGWCSPRTEHGMGDIAFGPDQQLYISAGDGAQLEGANSVGDGCGDPIGDPSALRAQDIRSPGDPTTLAGVVVRIDPSTGLASSGNPISGDENADRIIAVGLHNPTQIEFRPGTQQLWVGDDHPGSTSELNIVSVGDGLPNFGWPCREGDASVPEYAGAESCQNLTELEVTSPFATFRRAAHSGNNTACSVAPDSSTGGLAFYPGGSYPSRYHGALFMADAERGCVWSVFPDGNGNPDFSTSEEFLSGVSGVGSLSSGPDGDLLFLDGKEGTLHRVRYQADIVAPASVASLYVPAPPLPTTVLSPPTSAAIVAVAPEIGRAHV